MKFAKRISNLPPYVFASMAARIAERRDRGDTVINFGMGDPDGPMPDYIVESVCEAARDPKNHRYPGYYGLPELREAMSNWYTYRYGVELDPRSEVLPLIGSKEGIANIALAFCDPGELALVPNPGYPVYRYGTIMADGVVAELPLREEDGWLPQLEKLPPAICEQANVLWLNYPNNPTGAVADLEFFERVVHFARRHDIVVCHDNPYSDVVFDGYHAPSILEVPGAMDVAVEFNSLSKTFNMAGMRIGMVVGNRQVVEALGRIKSNIDSGVPSIVQRAAITALTAEGSGIAAHNEAYRHRRDQLVAALHAAGIEAPSPRASLYIWGKVPAGYTSVSLSDKLFDEAAIVVAPGTNFGSNGEGFFRMSLTVPDDEVDLAVERLQNLRL